MKIHKQEDLNFIRLSFGYKSVTMKDTTVEEVWNIVEKIFNEIKVDFTLKVKNHCVFTKPSKAAGLLMSIREEGGRHRSNGYKGKSKNKTIYCISDEEAMKIFLNNYEKHL